MLYGHTEGLWSQPDREIARVIALDNLHDLVGTLGGNRGTQQG